MKERLATTEEAIALVAELHELQATAERLAQQDRKERRRAQAIASGALSPANGIERYLANKARELEETRSAYQAKRDEVWSLLEYIKQLEANLRHSEAVRLQQNEELAKLGHVTEAYQ